MTAAEARAKAKEVTDKDANKQYSVIKEMIASAVNKGEYTCYIYNAAVKLTVRKMLEKEGFFVGLPQSDRNETFTIIKW